MSKQSPASSWLVGLLILLSLGLPLASVHAKKAHLVTYGSGGEVWEWFGHNAIWLQDPEQGLDHTFSFGYFDIEASGFYGRFLAGEMRYFGSSVPVEREFRFYRQLDRSIRVQELNLTDEQFDRLQFLLTNAIYPYPQYYDYDYYWANCSTWLRDLLNETTDGALSDVLQSNAAKQTFRQHTAAQTKHHPAAHLGLMMLLGPGADQPIKQWDEAFLPAALANQVSEIVLPQGPLVVSDAIIYEAKSERVDSVLVAGPGAFMAWGFLLAGLVLMPMLSRSRAAWVPTGMALLALSLAGIVIIGMSLFTAHEVVRGNQLLIVLHPLWLGLLPIWPVMWRRLAWGLSALIFGLGSMVWFSGLWAPQDGRVLWLLVPLVLALFWVNHRVLWSDQSGVRDRADG
ncbi:MAG TPA: DUF4105 domain-containing protein [Wenzhouxiangella sp.]